MTPQEITEGNKLIAGFMGYKLITPNMRKHPEEWTMSYWENPDFKGSSRGVLCSEHRLSYHNSWSWLMKVVEKIEKDNGVSIVGGPAKKATCVIHLSNLKAISGQGDTKIEAVYKAVVDFIKWYNQNKSK